MSYQEDLILSMYGRGEPGLAMADPLPKDDPNKRVPAPGKDGTPSSPYLPGKSPMPSKGLAHHTGGKHFTEPSMDELIEGLIEGEIPPGTLGDQETEERMIQEYMQRQQQSMFISPTQLALELGGSGRKLTLGEYKKARDIGLDNLMNSGRTDQDFESYLQIKSNARRQMFDGV